MIDNTLPYKAGDHERQRPTDERTLRLFRAFTAAIERAHQEGDDHTVNLLLVAKDAAVRRHHDAWGGRQ